MKRFLGNIILCVAYIAAVFVLSSFTFDVQMDSCDDEKVDKDEKTEEVQTVEENEMVYRFNAVEQLPQFQGGESEMYRWIAMHVQFPAGAANDCVSGRVIVEFVVSKTGKIENARVMRSLHPALDAEALRVVNSMPDWIPGRLNGKPVKVAYTLPITFRLTGI